MLQVLSPVLARWRLAALVISGLMLAIAHAFQRFGGLEPCLLCLRQREVYWAILAAAAGFMVLVRLPGGPRWREATCWILAVLFAAGASVAAYHAGVELKWWPGPTACGASASRLDAQAMSAFLEGAKVRAVRCDQPAWVFAGLSMAGWNALISLALAVTSVAAAHRERRRR